MNGNEMQVYQALIAKCNQLTEKQDKLEQQLAATIKGFLTLKNVIGTLDERVKGLEIKKAKPAAKKPKKEAAKPVPIDTDAWATEAQGGFGHGGAR